MTERNLAGELALLATDVDSLAKALVQSQAELSRETDRRNKADAKAAELREELGHARRRAQTAERELGKLTAGIQATSHSAEVNRRELETRLAQLQRSNEMLRQEVLRKERQRHALEQDLREVMENLRNAAQEAQGSTAPPQLAEQDEATLVPSRNTDVGW